MSKLTDLAIDKLAAQFDDLDLTFHEYKAGKKSDVITRYISDHVDSITLSELSKRFSYHPNYISALIRKKTGKTFKQLVLEERMRRAVILMKNTTLSVEEIAVMLGYSDQSNFYKAFREFYGVSPREYNQTK